jgi:hypothetical protein
VPVLGLPILHLDADERLDDETSLAPYRDQRGA